MIFLNHRIIYLSIVATPLETEAFKEGETGASPKNTSKRAKATFPDSIVAFTEDGRPSEETQTCITITIINYWHKNDDDFSEENDRKKKKVHLKLNCSKYNCKHLTDFNHFDNKKKGVEKA